MSKYFDLEIWECMVDAIETRFLRTEFEPGEFEVHSNRNAGTITVIRREDNRAWTLTDTTGSHYDAQDRIVQPGISA